MHGQADVQACIGRRPDNFGGAQIFGTLPVSIDTLVATSSTMDDHRCRCEHFGQQGSLLWAPICGTGAPAKSTPISVCSARTVTQRYIHHTHCYPRGLLPQYDHNHRSTPFTWRPRKKRGDKMWHVRRVAWRSVVH
jgi:hypothetical protein